MKNTYRKWIGERLRYFRGSMSQAVLAEKIGKKRAAYDAYEQGRAEPSIFTLKKICDLFNITIDKFLEDCPTDPATTLC